MPVVHVRSAPIDEPAAERTLAQIAGAVAAAVPCDIGGVWCTFEPIPVQTVGTRVTGGEGRIAYVDVWIRAREDADAGARALEAACRATADGFGIPLEDIWGSLHPVEAGRVFAGGALVQD